jgi:hypothetical protein
MGGLATTRNCEAIVRPLISQDEISRGLISGVSQWNKFGYREQTAASSGEQTLWALNSNLVIMKTAETFTITYNNTTDGLGTTGATQLTFYYLDANEKLAIGVHTLGNTGSDVTSFTGLGINGCVCSATGSNEVNANNITITNTTSGNDQAIIPAGNGTTQQLIFFAPDNATPVVKYLRLRANKLSGSNPKVTFKSYVWNRGVESTFEIFRDVLDTQSGTLIDIEDPCNFPLSSRDVLYFVMDTDQNNTVASGRFSLNLYDIL